MIPYIIPNVGTKGKFTFTAPFASTVNQDIEFTVKSIRSLIELIADGAEPLKTVYIAAGLTNTEYKSDIDNEVPIVVLASGPNNYLYVPANRIATLPNVSGGIRYQEVLLAINLGYLPIDYDTTVLNSSIVDTVTNTTGIISTVETVPTSAIVIVDEVNNDTYMQLLNTRKTVNESWQLKYLQLLQMYNDKNAELIKLKTAVKNKLCV